MKFIAFILGLIILALSVMPCTDAKAMNGKAKTELTQATHQQGNPLSDACSPFCQCACCVGFSIVKPITSFSIIEPVSPKSYSLFFSSSSKRISLPIWQPPQLV